MTPSSHATYRFRGPRTGALYVLGVDPREPRVLRQHEVLPGDAQESYARSLAPLTPRLRRALADRLRSL